MTVISPQCFGTLYLDTVTTPAELPAGVAANGLEVKFHTALEDSWLVGRGCDLAKSS